VCRLTRKFRDAARKKFVKCLGVEKELRVVLVRPDCHEFGVISLVQFGFDLLDLVFLHEEEICVELIRHVVMLVIAYFREITQHPWQGIRAGPNQVTYHLIVGRIGFRQTKEWFGELPDVVVSLDLNVGFPGKKNGQIRRDAAI
jgi:hypothetical protein